LAIGQRLERAPGNGAVVETLRRTNCLRVQRQIVQAAGGTPLDLDTVWTWLKDRKSPLTNTLREAVRARETVVKRAVKQLVESGDEYTLAQLGSMEWSDKGLALKGVPALDFSALRTKKKKAKKMIESESGSRFGHALLAAGDLGEADLIVTLGQQGQRGNQETAEEKERRRQSLVNLLANVPKVTIRKGTWLMHMTKSQPTDDWLKQGWIGGNSPDDYSFFTSYRRGPASAHANVFGGLLIYELLRDVHAFFIADYTAIVEQKYMRAVSDDTELAGGGRVGDKGGELASAFVHDLPEDKRPLAFVSPHEDELVFLNSQIRSIMGRRALVTTDAEKKKRGDAEPPGDDERREGPRAITNPKTRKIEKF
jgi:hypothetical protein